MTSVNQKKQDFIWFCNLFFLLVCAFHSGEDFEDPSENYPDFILLETIFSLEFKITQSTLEHLKCIRNIKSYFSNNYEDTLESIYISSFDLFGLRLGNYNKFLILNLTYIFSLYLACDEKLRSKFYELYNGKVPGITQWLLNSIRIGFINENVYVSEVYFDPNCDIYLNSPFLPRISMRFEAFCDGAELLAELFKQLEIYCSNNKLFFTHFVQLKKTPLHLTKEEKLTLTGFNQVNKKFLTSSIIKNSKQEEKYQLVNKSINAYLVSQEYYKKNEFKIDLDSSRWLGGGENPETWISEEKSKNYKFPLMSQLLDFIIHCNPDEF